MAIISTIVVLNACFWGLVWSMERIEKMEKVNAPKAKPKRKRVKKAVSEPIVIEEVVVEVAYEDDDIVIEDVH